MQAIGVEHQPRDILKATEHPDFPFIEGDTTFQVGHLLFAVNHYALIRHSPVFKDMFSLGPSATPQGSKENPIILPSLDPVHFERFLKILCPSRFDELPFKTAEEWYSVLVVADQYEFRECGIRNLAIKQLEKTASCIQKIQWGTQFGIRSLLVLGYCEACNRILPFTPQELVQLRLPASTIQLVMAMRETRLRAFKRCAYCLWISAMVSNNAIWVPPFPTMNPQRPLFVIGRANKPQANLYRPIKPLPARCAPPPRASRSFFDLCNPSTYVTVQELSRISLEAIGLICFQRENLIRGNRCERCVREGAEVWWAKDDVEKYFANQLKDAE